NGCAERLIGSIRRECLDHVIVFGERHLRHVLQSYAHYYNGVRTHLSLAKDSPLPRRSRPPAAFFRCRSSADCTTIMSGSNSRQRQLAEAGVHVVAPDMRGYGKSDAPEAIDQYTIFHLIGDLADLAMLLRLRLWLWRACSYSL